MVPGFDSNSTSPRDNAYVELVALEGATPLNIDGVTRSDGKKALATDSVTSLAPGSVQRWNSKLRLVDMNVASGGVARETFITSAAWVDIFSYSGTGIVSAFTATLETGADWRVRLLVDGQEIFLDSNGIYTNDMTSDQIYDLDGSGKSLDELFYGIGIFMGSHDQFRFSCPLSIPLNFSSSVVIKIKRETGAATKRFRGGLIVIQKDT